MHYLKQFLIAVFLLYSFSALAQEECRDQIEEANKLFEEGQFRQAETKTKDILENCVLSDDQENEMLKLIVSIYYEMDEIELAEEYVAKFVKKNPYYEASKKNDPNQFRDAVKKVKSYPRFSVGFKAGLPLGRVYTKKAFPILERADYLQDYTTKPIIQGGLEFSWNIISFLSINIGSGIRYQKILHQVPQYNGLLFNYQENNLSSTFPLSLGFTIPISRNFSSKLYFGGEIELFMQSKYAYFYSTEANISRDLSFYLSQKISDVKIAPEARNSYRYSMLGGVRFIYKIQKIGIFTDVAYIRELDLYNNSEKHFTDTDLYLNNNYVLGDIMLENLDISIGISYNFLYKVKSKY
jgi:hypothetical protein